MALLLLTIMFLNSFKYLRGGFGKTLPTIMAQVRLN